MNNNIIKSRKFKILISIFAVVLAGIMIYKLNAYTPIYADDRDYSYSWATGERITSVSQIFASQAAHWQVTNGRVVVHFFAQLFSMLSDNAFDILNTLGFLFLILIVCWHIYGSLKKINIYGYILTLCLVFIYPPSFGQSFLWRTGAANYLYGFLIILLFLLPYRMKAESDEKHHSPLYEAVTAVVMLCFGAVAGCTNENTSLAMLCMLVCYIAYYAIEKKKLNLWNFTGLAGGLAGCLFMILAPSTSIRMSSAGGLKKITDWIFNGIIDTFDAWKWLNILIIFLVVIIVLMIERREFKAKKNTLYISGIYAIGFAVSLYSMVVVQFFFSKRVWSGPIIMFIILLGILAVHMDWKYKYTELMKKIFLGVVILCSLLMYVRGYMDVKNTYSQFEEREAQLQTELEQGKTEAKVSNILGNTRYNCFTKGGYLGDNPKKWPNTTFAKYYGFEKVTKSDDTKETE